MSSIQRSFDGLIRSMSLAISPTWRRTFEETGALPLVVVLGDLGWTGETAPFQPRTAGGVDPRWADAIVVYVHPPALWDEAPAFNSGHVNGSGLILGTRDVALLVEILTLLRRTLEARYNERHPLAPITAASLDAERIFHPKQMHLFGYGQGAVLAYRLLAEVYPDADGVTYQFASMAVYGGTIGGYRGGRDVRPTPRYERRFEHGPQISSPIEVEILHAHGEDDDQFLPGTDHPADTWHDGYGRGTPSAALAAAIAPAYPAADGFIRRDFLDLTRCDYQIGHTVAPWYRFLMDAHGGIAILPPPFGLRSGVIQGARTYVNVATDVWAADLSYDATHRHFAIVIAGVGAQWPPIAVCDLTKLVLDFFGGTLTTPL